MNIIAITDRSLTNEQKDAVGKIWATNDNGTTYWFEKMEDVLPWMQVHDPETFAALVGRRDKARSAFREGDTNE
jgi:hypothetical protein